MRSYPVKVVRTALMLAVAMLGNINGYAQKALTALELPADSTLIFDAVTATPVSGQTHNLTPERYFIEISRDTLTCVLPFYGRRYSTPAPEEIIYGGYQFITTRFSVTVGQGSAKEKGILIHTRPYTDDLDIVFDGAKSGWGDVRIFSSGRDQISYYGRISKQKAIEK